MFDEVIYTDLEDDACKELVEKYRKEAQKLLPPPEKRWRGNDRFAGTCKPELYALNYCHYINAVD